MSKQTTRRDVLKGGAALAGLLAGLAWKLNHLGLLAVPVVIGLGILGADRLQGWTRRGLLLGAIGLGLRLWIAGLVIWAIGHALSVWVARRDPQFVDVARRHLRFPTWMQP